MFFLTVMWHSQVVLHFSLFLFCILTAIVQLNIRSQNNLVTIIHYTRNRHFFVFFLVQFVLFIFTIVQTYTFRTIWYPGCILW